MKARAAVQRLTVDGLNHCEAMKFCENSPLFCGHSALDPSAISIK
jgi:hypothetical protein